MVFSVLKNICLYFLACVTVSRNWLVLSDDERAVLEKAYFILDSLVFSSKK